jgi:hypothetical protein
MLKYLEQRSVCDFPVQASDRFTMKPISRADVAWYLVTLAEDHTPWQQRTPILIPAQGYAARRDSLPLAAGRTS